MHSFLGWSLNPLCLLGPPFSPLPVPQCGNPRLTKLSVVYRPSYFVENVCLISKGTLSRDKYFASCVYLIFPKSRSYAILFSDLAHCKARISHLCSRL